MSLTHGNRFANEFGKAGLRDCRDVEEQISVQSHSEHSELLMEIAWHCKHHTGRGVTNFYKSGAAALALDTGVPVSKMWESIEAKVQASLKIAQGHVGTIPSGSHR